MPAVSRRSPSTDASSVSTNAVSGMASGYTEPPAVSSVDSAAAPAAGDVYHAPGAVPATGSLDYYSKRHMDFGTRYAAERLTPPVYYLGYGFKYVERFTSSTSPQLSAEGQAWLVRARVNLQAAIENRRAAGDEAFDALEKNDSAFTAFAYGTHADAYWNAGLGDLNLFDLAVIGTTPDVRDLIAKEGLLQVADIGSRLMTTWGEDAIDFVGGEGTTEELVQAAYEGFEIVGDGVDEVFGEGTAASLVEGASELGGNVADVAGEVASGAYDLAAEGVGVGVDAIDSLVGEVGATEHAVDYARETVQSGFDWAGDVWDDIWN